MIDTLDPVFAAAVRRELVETADAAGARAPRRTFWSRRAWLIGGLSAALLAGAGVATAVLAGPPGGEVVTPLGESTTTTVTGPGNLDVGPAPDDATAIEYSLECVSAGRFEIVDVGGIVCSHTDASPEARTAWGQMELSAAPGGAIEVRAGDDDRWSLTARYVSTEPVPLAVNANGETYGTEAFDAVPDLILAYATNGNEGYIRRSELEDASGPTPTSPAHAVEIQEAREPGSVMIPVYESDGETVIGEFAVG